MCVYIFFVYVYRCERRACDRVFVSGSTKRRGEREKERERETQRDMYPGLISTPPFLSHPYHYHQAALVQHEGMFISPLIPCHQPHHLLQGLIQLPINPLCHPHHDPIPEEPSHPLISMTSDVKPRLHWTPELHACTPASSTLSISSADHSVSHLSMFLSFF